MKLNLEQHAAVHAKDGAWCLLASPGSGKTLVLTERIKRLLAAGFSMADLLGLTFTVEAANEMSRRLKIKEPKVNRGGLRTFHSFGLNLIKHERQYLSHGLSHDPVPAGNVVSKLLGQALKLNGLTSKNFEEVRAYISSKKRHRVNPEQALANIGPWESEQKVMTYKTYDRLLTEACILDFDDMVLKAVELLEIPEVADRWQFKQILVDEGQDTDDLQFSLLRLISARHQNLFIVGDFCQALYGFRGAHPENLLNFRSWFPEANTLCLPHNYRSTPQVVSFCKNIAPVRNELTLAMRTDNADGAAVEFRMYDSSVLEAESILAAAQSDLGRSAVLFRTNAQSGIFETLCVERGLKFHVLGKAGFWKQSEVQAVVGLAGFLLGSKPPASYPQELVQHLRYTVRAMSAADGVKVIIAKANLEGLYADEDYENDDNFALSNLQSLQKIANRFQSLREFVAHAHRAEHASRKSKNALTIGTVHAAKGLEWDNVFVSGVQEGLLPHKKGDLGEEQRIFYVACSRAAKRLRISWAGTPSQFVRPFLTPEIKKQLGDHQERLTQTSLFI